MKEYQVLMEPEAQKDLQNIYDFISANDTEVQAGRFLQKLRKAILSLNFMPFRCRKSIYLEDENVRDMIVQGYTITYMVKEDTVHILAIFRQKI